MKYWIKLKAEDIILQHTTVDAADLSAALVSACNALDLSKPMIYEKHKTEMEQFFRTVFYSDDFVDTVHFDTMEIEIITRRKKQ